MKRMIRAPGATLTLALLIGVSGEVAAAAPPATTPPSPGKQLFDRWCTECHGPGHGHPGTQQLERIRGAKLAVLEQRRDLNAGLIRYVVRTGQVAMPAYRPSEITDAELDQIAAYLVPGRKPRR